MFLMMQQLTTKVTQLTDTQNNFSQQLGMVQEQLNQQQSTIVKAEPSWFKQAITVANANNSLASPGTEVLPSLETEAKPKATANQASDAGITVTKKETVVNQELEQLLAGAGCLNHIRSGAIVTQHGGLIKDSAKVKPAPSDEKDIRAIAERRGTKIISLTSNKDRAMAASILSATRIAWPNGGAFDTDTVKLPVLTAECTTSPTAFVKWQQSVVDACKCASVHDILLISLDVLSNRILNSDFLVGEGVQDQQNMAALKAAIIRACYDLSNQLYYVLKRAIMANEPVVLESLQNNAKLYEAADPPLWLEGNVNYLWRCLDENYHRVTCTTIQQANRVFDNICYGNKGKQSVITSAATTKLTLDIIKANRELSYVDRPRSDESLRSLLNSCLPDDLWQFAVTVDVNMGDKRLPFSELSARLIEHARTIEERRGSSASNQTNHISVSGSIGNNAQCKYCHTDSHTTADHRKCPKCNGLHAPRQCPKGAAQAKGKSSQEGKPRASRVNLVEVENVRPFICNVVTSREGNEIIGVHYAAGGVELRTHLQCVIDSGAGAHISCSETHMFDVKELDSPVYVTLPDGGSIRVLKYGSMMLTKHMMLTRVLLVPKFRLNIISVARLGDKGVYCKFGPKQCVGRVHDKNSNEWLSVFEAEREANDVYILHLPKTPYEPIKGFKSKKLTSNQLASSSKKAEYLNQKGQATSEPTTIGVKASTNKIKKLVKSKPAPQSAAAPASTDANAGTTVVPANMVTSYGGPDASDSTSSSDEE